MEPGVLIRFLLVVNTLDLGAGFSSLLLFHLCLNVIYGEVTMHARLHSICMLMYFMPADKFWVQTWSKNLILDSSCG